MSRWNDWGWYPKPAPKRPPPKHGIKVKKIGATWWGQRWIEALEKLSWQYSNRLPRGRTYARAGRVHDLEVEPGKVTARVTGTHPTPYRVTLQIAVLDATAWDKAIAEMAKQAIFTAELLAGQMPKEIDQAFRATGGSLFPAKEKELQTDCSCPDWANPCKHIAATHYVLGEAFDQDPFLLLKLRGMGREELFSRLETTTKAEDAAPQETPSGESGPLPPDPSLFWKGLQAPVSASESVRPPPVAAAAVRRLGPFPFWRGREDFMDIMESLYRQAGAAAWAAWSGEGGEGK